MKHNLFVLVFSLLLFCSSCSMEYKLAKTYVNQTQGANAAVFFPEMVSVENKRDSIYGPDLVVLNQVDQNQFLSIVSQSFIKTLGDYGINIYVPEDENDVQVDSVHWLVSLSRMEMQESVTNYQDVWYSNNEQYGYMHPLNTINVASWFELNDFEWSPVLFVEHDLVDGFDSKVDYAFWTVEMNYKASIDTLKATDVYHYAVFLGKLYAGYTFDYFMNNYVKNKLALKKRSAMNYYRYDPYTKSLFWADNKEKFIPIQ